MDRRHRPSQLGDARDSRGRPYRSSLQPAGSTLVVPGPGITAGSGTIYRSAVFRAGGLIYTDILMDLTGLASSTTDLDIIGTAGVSYIAQIKTAVSGTILGGSMTCLEVPAGGADDIDLYAATEGTGAYDGAIGDLTETAIVTAGGAWALSAPTKSFIADTVAADKYIYLTGGEAGAAGTYTAGRFHIRFIGY